MPRSRGVHSNNPHRQAPEDVEIPDTSSVYVYVFIPPSCFPPQKFGCMKHAARHIFLAATLAVYAPTHIRE